MFICRHPFSTASSAYISHASFSYLCLTFFLIMRPSGSQSLLPRLEIPMLSCFLCVHNLTAIHILSFPLQNNSQIHFFLYRLIYWDIHCFFLITCLNQWNLFLGSSQMPLSFLFNQFSIMLPAGFNHPRAACAIDSGTLLLCSNLSLCLPHHSVFIWVIPFPTCLHFSAQPLLQLWVLL